MAKKSTKALIKTFATMILIVVFLAIFYRVCNFTLKQIEVVLLIGILGLLAGLAGCQLKSIDDACRNEKDD